MSTHSTFQTALAKSRWSNSCRDYPNTWYNGSQIDHLFLSSDVHEEQLDPDSFSLHTDLESKPNFRKTYSDHFPLTFTVEIVDDDD